MGVLSSPLRRPPPPGDEPYDAKPDRPVLQIVVRAGLWLALGIGCLGGIVALLRPPARADDTVEPPPPDPPAVPAPVAGVAELTVEEWLTTPLEERDGLARLFVEPPATADRSGTSVDETRALDVRRVTTIGGRRLDDAYWSVTLVADLVVDDAVAATEETEQPDEPDGPDETGDQTGGVPPPSRWYLQVGIVEDGDGGFVALAPPAVVPPPEPGDPEWRVSGSRATAEEDDPLAHTVEQFLGAMFAGAGDPEPYFTPGAEMPPLDPPPFVEMTVVDLSVDELDDGGTWVLAHVVGTTADGVPMPLTYDLVLADRGDRWEVEQLAGFPTLVE